MVGRRPPDTTPLDELREARAALDLGRKYIEAAYGPLGLVRLSDLSGENALALRLLHDALGYAPDRVHKRVASGAVTAVIRVLDGFPPAHGVTVAAEVNSQEPAPQTDDTDEKADDSRSRAPAPPRPGVIITPPPRETSGTQVRRFTDAGIERAKEFLAYMREHPDAKREPPPELLFGERYSRPFRESVRVERRPFRTRREAAEYFAPKFNSIRHLVADHAELWSWLGMYYFSDTVRVESGVARLSREDETFVFDRQDGISHRRRFRHYLWSSWRLYETHGEGVAFLLDKDLTWIGQLALRSLDTVRIFNSAGIIQLMLRLYTHNGRQKRGFMYSSGGQRHLIRVLDQLERTYDVYGMDPDALIRVLPEEFQRWDSQSAPGSLNGETSSKPTAMVAVDPDADAPDAAYPEQATPNPITARAADPSAAHHDPAEPLRGSKSSPRTARPGEPRQPPSPQSFVRQTLLDIRVQIEQRGQVTWTDPREHLEEGSEAWKAYVAVCGVPERRLFRTAFLYRLNEVLAALD